MPPRHKYSPKPLEELCFVQFMHYLELEVLFCIEVERHQDTSLFLRRRGIDAPTILRELSSHFNVLPPLLRQNIRQQMANRLLNVTPLPIAENPSVLTGMLNVVLNKEVKSLEIRNSHLDLNATNIWETILDKCTQLQRFVVPEHMSSIDPQQFHCFLQIVSSNFSGLTELVLRNMFIGYDETVETIGQCCPMLKKLDLTGSEISCKGVMRLCLKPKSDFMHYFQHFQFLLCISQEDLNPLCNTMEELLLGDTQVKDLGAAFVIKAIPNLKSLGNLLYLTGGLKMLYGPNGQLKPPLKLTQASYRGKTNIKLKSLMDYCPNVEELHIGAESVCSMQSSIFQHFKKLRSLSVVNIRGNDISLGLQHLHHLTELKVSSSDVDVGLVGRYCTQLKSLYVEESLGRPTLTPNSEMFTELQTLKLTCSVSKESAELIICQAYKLQTINLRRVDHLTDSVFSSWLSRNPLLYLETLNLCCSDLTRKSVDLLLVQCPHLTRLGNLCGWNIRAWECRRINDVVLREKYRLTVVSEFIHEFEVEFEV